MNTINVCTIDGLDPRDMLAIRSRLTNAGSEFQVEVTAALEGEASSCTPLAVWHHDGALVGWACSHVWRGVQTLEQYTDERHRNTGKGAALAAVLIASRTIDPKKPLAVFSPVTADIARRLGVTDVVLYQRVGADWLEM